MNSPAESAINGTPTTNPPKNEHENGQKSDSNSFNLSFSFGPSKIRKITSSVSSLLRSSVQLALSKPALVTYAKVWIYSFFSSALLLSAIWIYFMFYRAYVPSASYSKEAHLQFPSPISCLHSRGLADISLNHDSLLLHKKECKELGGSHPFAKIDISDNDFFPGQPYSVGLKLELPRSRQNERLGNFMVSMHLYGDEDDLSPTAPKSDKTQLGLPYGADGIFVEPLYQSQALSELIVAAKGSGAAKITTNSRAPSKEAAAWMSGRRVQPLLRSSRPASIKHRSSMVSMVQDLIMLPFHVVGLVAETDMVGIRMVDSFRYERRGVKDTDFDALPDYERNSTDKAGPHRRFVAARPVPKGVALSVKPTLLQIDIISTDTVEISRATIEITAQMEGLRYWMHSFFVPTAFVGVLLIWYVQMGFMSIGLLGLTLIFGSGMNAGAELAEQGEGLSTSNAVVKLEPARISEVVVKSEFNDSDESDRGDGSESAYEEKPPEDVTPSGASTGVSFGDGPNGSRPLTRGGGSRGDDSETS